MSNRADIKWKESKINSYIDYPRLFPLWMAVFIDILGFYLILPFLPSFINSFNVSPIIVGLLISVNAIFTFVFAPILGNLSDKYGRKPLLLISQAGTMSAFLILAFSNSILLIFISRMIDGIFGGNFPIAKAVISDVVPPKDRGAQMTNIGVAHVLSSLIGPGLGGILFSIGGILLPGIMSATLSLFTMVITYILLDESWPRSKREEYKSEQKENKAKIKIYKNKNALYLLVLWGFHTISFTLFVSNMSQYLGIIIGLIAFEIGIILTISGLFRAITRFAFFKPLLRKIGGINMIKMGLIMFVIFFLLLGFSYNPIMIIFASIFLSFAASSVRGNLLSVISQSVSPKIQGRINSYTTSLDSVAQIIGPLIGGIIFDLSFTNIIDPYWWGIVMSVIGSFALFMFVNKFKSSKKDIKNKKLRKRKKII
ncbi:MAG: MFS transporter [Promethearchaeota archaeon]|nr:MAG: MFS transporter [Candidatus Lokiarchaeota archaeon]